MKNLTQFKNLNILYVDDDPIACKKLEKILRYYFAEVYIANSATEALEIYKKGKCNLLLVDYNMPVMTGADFLKEVRTLDTIIPAIIVSSYDDKEKLFNAIELQLVSYLVKPYSMDELKKVFYKALDWIESKGLLEKALGEGKTYSYSTKKIYDDGEEIDLSPSEFKILEILLNNENQLINYDELMDAIGDKCTHKSLVNQMHKLKKKMEVDIIKNIKDFGYILTKK